MCKYKKQLKTILFEIGACKMLAKLTLGKPSETQFYFAHKNEDFALF
jgi:hypothetical protein